MDWTLCLLCALISMTSIRCYRHIPSPYHQYGQIETNHDRQGHAQRASLHDQATQRISGDQATQRLREWVDQATQRISEREHYQATQQISESDQATHRTREWVDQTSQRLSEGDDQATQRMSERSLPLDSGRQRLQELQRRRFNQEDEGLRIVNVNKNSGFNSTPRRGMVPDPVASPDVVVFPGPSRRSDQTLFVPSVPEECLRTGICEDLPDYPEDRVAAIIEQLGNATDKYKVDELDTPEIAQRIGPPEEMELCEFSLKVAVPKAAPDKDGKWHYILNQKDKPLQGFHVEICSKADSPCSKLAYFYSGYEASCKQKYMLRYMAGLNADGQVVEKQFKIPSCCSCVVRQTD
ncbi:protein spaetzle-like isoform X1 [Cydia splendana]|uniref:protein spaetzle-like isoform X1 n=1 Tax=Cydia splendana TaxID=1100963 RepID=UPI00300BFE31